MPGEESVWSDFKAGDRVAYEKVIRDYYQDLYVYGLRLIDNPDFIKDCIHDQFVYLWDRRSYLGETDDIRLYLLKSLRNRVVKQAVKEARLVELGEGVSRNLPSEWSVEDEIVRGEHVVFTRKSVESALKELSSRQREVVHLRFYEGLSNERIAGIMNISKPAVANLVHASLKTLRTIWRVSYFILLSFFS